MEDLCQLDRSLGPISRGCLLSQWPIPSPTPLQASSVWQLALRDYPDLRLHQFLVPGLRIGYNTPRAQLRPAKRNIPSAYKHPEVADRYLEKGCKLGRVIGSQQALPPCPLHISQFGVIPKNKSTFTPTLAIASAMGQQQQQHMQEWTQPRSTLRDTGRARHTNCISASPRTRSPQSPQH